MFSRTVVHIIQEVAMWMLCAVAMRLPGCPQRESSMLLNVGTLLVPFFGLVIDIYQWMYFYELWDKPGNMALTGVITLKQ